MTSELIDSHPFGVIRSLDLLIPTAASEAPRDPTPGCPAPLAPRDSPHLDLTFNFLMERSPGSLLPPVMLDGEMLIFCFLARPSLALPDSSLDAVRFYVSVLASHYIFTYIFLRLISLVSFDRSNSSIAFSVLVMSFFMCLVSFDGFYLLSILVHRI